MNLLCRVASNAHRLNAAVAARGLKLLPTIAIADQVEQTRRALGRAGARAIPGGVFRDSCLYAGGVADAAART